MVDRPPHRPDPGDDPLDAWFRAARRAPLPPAAARLALGFGPRQEARLRALTETQDASQFLWRWVTGLGLCAAIALAAASTLGRSGHPSPDPHDLVSESPLQSAWDGLTALPEAWPQL